MDIGTIIWCAFGALLAYALLTKLAELVWFVLEGAWLFLVRPHRPADSPGSAPDRVAIEVDDAPWADAYSESFADGNQGEAEHVWVPPVPPDDAACHVCGGPLLYVVYGFPGGDLVQLAEQGRVILGGCMPGGPRFRCLQGHPVLSGAEDVLEPRPAQTSPVRPPFCLRSPKRPPELDVRLVAPAASGTAEVRTPGAPDAYGSPSALPRSGRAMPVPTCGHCGSRFQPDEAVTVRRGASGQREFLHERCRDAPTRQPSAVYRELQAELAHSLDVGSRWDPRLDVTSLRSDVLVSATDIANAADDACQRHLAFKVRPGVKLRVWRRQFAAGGSPFPIGDIVDLVLAAHEDPDCDTYAGQRAWLERQLAARPLHRLTGRYVRHAVEAVLEAHEAIADELGPLRLLT